MSDDGIVDVLRKSRGSAAELKLRLINLRSEAPDDFIFVFEGDIDRAVYYSWTRFLDGTFRYEPFTCNGKAGVLSLKQAVDRDAAGLAKSVFFFIDRDFDDSRGIALDNSIYMTDCYSVENYLVSSEVLEEVLKIEFHCHSAPQIRSKVRGEFERLYDRFLAASEHVNRELFCARRLGIELEQDLGSKISGFVTITLDDVQGLPASAHEVIRPVRPLTNEEREGLSHEFDVLERSKRYRGKYSLSFFMRWLEHLAKARVEQDAGLFEGLNIEVRVRLAHLAPATLSSRSVPPESFRRFFSQLQIQAEPVQSSGIAATN